jgi:hypothetical protein
MNRVEAAYTKFRETIFHEYSPREINQGMCWQIAVKVQAELSKVDLAGDPSVMKETHSPDAFPKALRFENTGHVWIYDRKSGLHHDVEQPAGKRDWRKLPFFNR